MKDVDAVARLKSGDISGLDVLVQRYQIKAVRVAYLITHDTWLAEDIMQSAFVRAYERISQFDSQYPFESWFMRIVVNMALQTAGGKWRDVSLDDALAESLSDGLLSPEQHVEDHELERLVSAALLKLTPEQRVVIVLRYYLGYTESEIVSELKKPLGTIRWRLHAARRQLKGLLQHNNTSRKTLRGEDV